jgi:RNase H-like domain found in reverse transcriptase
MDHILWLLHNASSPERKRITLCTSENCSQSFTRSRSGACTCYLYGSRFVIKADHNPLRYLDTQTNLSKRKMRWMETLQEYDYEIVHVQIKFNVVADALFRINESPSSEIYTGEDEEEAAEVVALNVVGTVSRSMLTKSMLSEVLSAYNPADGIFEKYPWMDYCMRWTMDNGSWL